MARLGAPVESVWGDPVLQENRGLIDTLSDTGQNDKLFALKRSRLFRRLPRS